MTTSRFCSARRAFSVFALFAITSLTASAQLIFKNSENENVNIKIGVQGQFWADWKQSSATGRYDQTFFLHRARLLMGGQLGKNLNYFVVADAPNLFKQPKSQTKPFMVQDAYIEWTFKNALRFDGGYMLIPYAHNALQSTASYYTLDVSPLTALSNMPTHSSLMRDVGLQARGFLLRDHLAYRIGSFKGQASTSGAINARTAGYVQYDFLSPEKEYMLAGTALGKRKILALSSGFDRQSNYRAYSAGLAADIPVHNGDEIGGQVQYIYYDGRNTFKNILEQNDCLFELAYYSKPLKLQPFGKFEIQDFAADSARSKNLHRYGTGVNYYIHAQNLKLTFQYSRANPRLATNTFRPANELAVQLQVFYF